MPSFVFKARLASSVLFMTCLDWNRRNLLLIAETCESVFTYDYPVFEYLLIKKVHMI